MENKKKKYSLKVLGLHISVKFVKLQFNNLNRFMTNL